MSITRFFLLLALATLVAIAGCNSKKYRCQVSGQPEPRSEYEFVQRGVEHARRDELNCARDACAEAIRLGPSHAAGYGCRGSVLLQEQRLSEAIKDFDRAIGLEPQNGDYHFQRGKAFALLKNYDSAVADFDKAIEGISSEVGRSMVYAERAEISGRSERTDEAIKDYDEAIKLAPGFAYHYYNRGNLYFAKENFQKALDDFNSAIQHDASNQFFYLSRAKTHRTLRQLDLATKDEANAKLVAASQTPLP